MKTKTKKKQMITFAIMLIITIIYTIMVAKIDVKQIRPNDSMVGFASINKFFANFGQNNFFYVLTQIIGVIAIGIMGIFALFGVYQLITKKSIKKINPNLIKLGVIYAILIFLYILFDKLIIINYRPILDNGKLEPSFPSSHTMLAITVFGSCIMFLNNNKKIKEKEEKGKIKVDDANIEKKEKAIKIIKIILLIFAILMPIGRLLSGVHWFTDIVGGILFSIDLLLLYKILINN